MAVDFASKTFKAKKAAVVFEVSNDYSKGLADNFKEAFEKANIFGTGTANTAYAQYFIGNSFLNPLTDPKSGLEENNAV